MNIEDLRKFCLGFPEATENMQWGDDLCFKFRGKIFTTIALSAVPHKICFKCTPELFAELTEREGIHPAPYVGRYKWVIVDSLSDLRDYELRDFVRQSYEMIATKAPKGKSAKLKPKRVSPAKYKTRPGAKPSRRG